jgi:6-pyruvoyltetrahydropterin/6-carboxytetrahydropterin synthase
MPQAPQVTITRRLMFNAAHRVHNPDLSDEENQATFGKCNNPNWHGHNYTLDVSVTGPIDERTGYVIDLSKIKAVVGREVVDKVDHKNFNLDVDSCCGRRPTTTSSTTGSDRASDGRRDRRVARDRSRRGVRARRSGHARRHAGAQR